VNRQATFPIFTGFIETGFEQRFQGLLRQAWRQRSWHVIDDAHDLSMQHLIFVKELTDQLRLHYGYPVGLCLVAAGRGAAVPLKDILDQPETMWMQFRRRLDRVSPYCRIASHTQEEVRDILGTLERIYHPHFPALNLQQWTGSIYTWLTHPLLDPQTSGRVNMDGLMKLVTTALEVSYAQGREDVTPHALEVAAQLLLLTRDNIPVIDAPASKQAPAPSQEEATGQATATRPKKRKRESEEQPAMSPVPLPESGD
jgi:hypothetical protein